MTDCQIILKDMKETKTGQASWDWEADLRFAKSVKGENEVEILNLLMNSHTVFPILISTHKEFITKLKNRRLRALRKLEQQGLVYSGWRGTGEGGFSEFGTRRVKSWHLIK